MFHIQFPSPSPSAWQFFKCQNFFTNIYTSDPWMRTSCLGPSVDFLLKLGEKKVAIKKQETKKYHPKTLYHLHIISHIMIIHYICYVKQCKTTSFFSIKQTNISTASNEHAIILPGHLRHICTAKEGREETSLGQRLGLLQRCNDLRKVA